MNEPKLHRYFHNFLICFALCLGNYWVDDIAGNDSNTGLVLTALILACWGIALYRYYNSRPSLFRD